MVYVTMPATPKIAQFQLGDLAFKVHTLLGARAFHPAQGDLFSQFLEFRVARYNFCLAKLSQGGGVTVGIGKATLRFEDCSPIGELPIGVYNFYGQSLDFFYEGVCLSRGDSAGYYIP